MPISFFEELSPETLQLPDEQFVRQLTWSKDVAADLVRAAKDGDIGGLTKALQLRLAESAKRSDGISNQSLWSETAFPQTDRSRSLVALLSAEGIRPTVAGDRKTKPSRSNGKPSKNGPPARVDKNLSRWVNGIERGAVLTEFEQLLLGDVLIGRDLPPRTFFRIWRALLTAAIELSNRLQNELSPESEEHRLIVIAGEIPWRAGHLFQDISKSRRLRERGCQVLHELLTESTDTDGTPRAALLEDLPFWIAALVRATIWARVFHVEFWDDASDERFADAVRRAVAVCRPDGQMPFTDLPATVCASILKSAAQSAGFRKKSAVRSFVSSLGDEESKSATIVNGKTSGRRKPGFQSDWAAVACLRNRIAIDSDQVSVRYDQLLPVLDVSVLGVPLMGGAWGLTITVDGQLVEPTCAWNCTCWHSDRDSDYIELQLQLDEIAVQRQILLSRKQHFLMLADVLSGAGRTPVALESHMALHDHIAADHDVTTREIRLSRHGLKARVLPLGLDQDRIMSTPGSCSVDDGRLCLTQQGEGGLYAPTIIDWHPDRQSEPCDWTRLTVTESRTIVTPNIAAGFRVRTGSHQLLIYRSLQETEIPRAVLGHHTHNETVVARFTSGGQVNPIVLVEP